jgi:hypothetical protein
VLTTPTPSSKLSGSSVTFGWTAGSGVTDYKFWLGSAPGLDDLYRSGWVTATSAAVTCLPTNGVTVYATLWSEINGVWQSTPYTYTEAGTPAPAVLQAPAPGSTLGTTDVTFSWTPGVGATAYELFLGTNGIGSSNLYHSGSTTATSVTVDCIPANASTVYAYFCSKINGAWQCANYTYTEQ